MSAYAAEPAARLHWEIPVAPPPLGVPLDRAALIAERAWADAARRVREIVFCAPRIPATIRGAAGWNRWLEHAALFGEAARAALAPGGPALAWEDPCPDPNGGARPSGTLRAASVLLTERTRFWRAYRKRAARLWLDPRPAENILAVRAELAVNGLAEATVPIPRLHSWRRVPAGASDRVSGAGFEQGAREELELGLPLPLLGGGVGPDR